MLHHEPKEADGNDAHKRFAGRLFGNARRALGARTTGLAELTTRTAAGCRTPATPPRAHTPRPNHHQLAPREGVREKSFIPCSTARTPRDSSRSPSSAMALECRPAEGHVGPPGRGRRRTSPGAARSSAGARRGGEVRKGDKKPNGRNLPNIQPSGNRGTPRVPGSLPGHDTTCQMPQPGSSRRVTLYSAAITAPARPPAPPGQWRRSCGWA